MTAVCGPMTRSRLKPRLAWATMLDTWSVSLAAGTTKKPPPNPQFDNREYVPVAVFAVFAKPATDGPVEVVTDWKCFNSRLRRQIVTEPAAVGVLQGQGRAGSPYEVVGLPNSERANEAYEFVLETARKEGWLTAADVASVTSGRMPDEDYDAGEF